MTGVPGALALLAVFGAWLFTATKALGLAPERRDRNWLAGLPEAAGRLWLRIGILMILLFWPLALAGDMAASLEPFSFFSFTPVGIFLLAAALKISLIKLSWLI